MPNIDEKVVQMTFDNKQFEKGVAQSLKSLEDLKKALELDKMNNSLKNLEKATDSISSHLGTLQESVSKVSSIFTPLGNLGVNALNRISNAALDAGKNLAKMMLGFEDAKLDVHLPGQQKYEMYTKSVQTITNATGKSLEEVEKVLEKLMKYTDETSYDFSEMSSSIGKFTSVGIDLERAEAAMEGIANWAAKSGAGKTEANRAMYNISQAMGAGYMKLIDWKSIENANMATKEFKETAIATAEELGVISKNSGITYQNFNETLKDGWLTAEVLTTILEKYSDTSQDFGLSAYHAAQEALTFSDAIDALKDSVSTGWLTSLKLMFGNLDEARVLWTNVATALQEFAGIFSEERNELLKGWHDLGGYNAAVEAASNIWKTFTNIVLGVKEAFEDIFPPATADQLVEITKKVRDATEEWKKMFGLDTETEVTEEYDALINKAAEFDKIAKKGAKSDYVKDIQTQLVKAGYLSDMKQADGIYGDKTEAAIKKLQKALGVDVTGAWDAATMKAATLQNVFVETEKRQRKETLHNVEEITELQKDEIDHAKDLDLFLTRGDRFAQVKTLQEMLVQTGYLSDISQADGVYGPDTQEAVKKLQKDLGVEVTGSWNDATRAAVFAKKLFTEVTETEVTVYKSTGGITEQMITLQNIVKGLLSVVKLGASIIVSVIKIAGNVMKIFTPLINVGFKALGVFGEMLQNVADGLNDTDKFGKIVEKVTDFLSPFADAIAKAAEWIDNLLDGYKDFIAEFNMGNTFKSFFAFLSKRFEGNEFVGSIVNVFKTVKQVVSDVFGYVKSAVAYIFGMNEETDGEKKNGIIVFFNTLLKVVTVIAKGIAIAVALIGYAFGKLFGFAQKYLKPVIDKLKELFDKVITKFKGANIKSISDFFKTLSESIGDSKVGKFFSDAIAKIKEFYDKAKTYLQDNFPSVIEFFKNKWEALKNFFKFDSNADFLTNLKNKFEQLKSVVANAIKNVRDKLSKFKEYLKNLFGRDENGKLNLFTELEKAVQKFKPIIDKLVEYKDKFVAAIKEIFGVGKEKGSELLKDNKFTSVFDKIKEFFGNATKIDFGKLIGPALAGLAAYSIFSSAKAIKNISKGLLGLMDHFTGGKILANQKKDTIGDTALKIAGSIALVALAIGLLSVIDAKKAQKGIEAFEIVLWSMVGAMAALMVLNKFTGSENNFGTQALMLAGSVAALAAGLWLMMKVMKGALQDPETLKWSLGLIAGMLIALGTIEILIAKFSKGRGSLNISGVLQMCIGIGVLALAFGHIVRIVTENSNEDLLKASAIIVTLISLVGGIAVLLSNSDSGGSLKISGMLAMCVGIAGLVIAFNNVIDTINNNDTGVVVGAVAIVAGMCVGLIKIAETLNGANISVTAVLSQLATGAVIYEIGKTIERIAGSLSDAIVKIQDVDTAIIISFLGGFAVITGVMGGLAIAFSAIPLGALVQGGVALLALSGLIGLSLEIFSSATSDGIEDMGSSIWLLGNHLSEFSDLISNINWDNMSKVGTFIKQTLPEMFANMTDLKTDEALTKANQLNQIGGHLRNFGDSMGGITEDQTTGASYAESLAESAANIHSKLSSITNIDGLSETLTDLGSALGSYYDEIKKIGTNSETGEIETNIPKVDSKMISEAFNALAEAIPEEANKTIQSYAPSGTNSLTKAALGIRAIGNALRSYGENIGGLSIVKVWTANRILDTIKGLFDDFKEQNNNPIAHFFHAFDGDEFDDLSSFSAAIEEIAGALGTYISETENINESKIKHANGVIAFIKTIDDTLPSDAGFLGKLFAGKESLGQFASNFGALGTGVKNFANNVADAKFDNVPNAMTAVQTLADVLGKIEKTGGIESWFVGDKSLSVLGKGLPDVGTSLKQFSDNVQGFTYESVAGALYAFKRIVEMAADVQDIQTYDKWDNPVNKLSAMGEGLRSFFTDVASIGTDMTNSKNGVNTGVLESMSQLGKYFIDGIVSGIEGADAGEAGSERIQKALNKAIIDAVASIKKMDNAYSDTGSKIVESMTKGVESDTTFRKTLLKLVVDTITAINNMRDTYMRSGSSIIENMVRGLNSNTGIRSTLMSIVINAITDVRNLYNVYYQTGAHIVNNIANGMNNSSDNIRSILQRTIVDAILSVRNLYDYYYNTGEYLMSGITSGIVSRAYNVINTVSRIMSTVISVARRVTGVNSPSKEFAWIASMWIEGITTTLDDQGNDVISTMQRMCEDVIDSTNDIFSEETVFDRFAESMNAAAQEYEESADKIISKNEEMDKSKVDVRSLRNRIDNQEGVSSFIGQYSDLIKEQFANWIDVLYDNSDVFTEGVMPLMQNLWKNAIDEDAEDDYFRPIINGNTPSYFKAGTTDTSKFANVNRKNLDATASLDAASKIALNSANSNGANLAYEILARDKTIATAYQELANKMEEIGRDMKNLKVYLNGHTLVGEIMPDVNRGVGKATARDLRIR